MALAHLILSALSEASIAGVAGGLRLGPARLKRSTFLVLSLASPSGKGTPAVLMRLILLSWIPEKSTRTS